MNQYENDIEHFIDITPIVDEKNFMLLLLADMASKNEKDASQHRIANLPRDFATIIDNIMSSNEELVVNNFSAFMNIKDYYNSKAEYQIFFDKGLYEALNMQKHLYHPEIECVSVIFSDEEIQRIKDNYDPDILAKMDPIATLMNHSITESMQEKESNIKS